MGLLSFVKNAGTKLFGLKDSPEEKQKKIIAHLNSFNLDTSRLQVTVADETVHLSGNVKSIFDKIRIVATAGNVEGIFSVNDDRLAVGERVDVNIAPEQPQKQYYTVAKGDTLSKISKNFYGDVKLYNKIFEANRPMLKNPDLIYPGQMLVIPE